MLPNSRSFFYFKKKKEVREAGKEGKNLKKKIIKKGQAQYAFEWQPSLQFQFVQASPI